MVDPANASFTKLMLLDTVSSSGSVCGFASMSMVTKLAIATALAGFSGSDGVRCAITWAFQFRASKLCQDSEGGGVGGVSKWLRKLFCHRKSVKRAAAAWLVRENAAASLGRANWTNLQRI